MTLDQIVQKFIANPKYLTNGAGALARKWDCYKQDITEARAIARDIINKQQGDGFTDVELLTEKVSEEGDRELTLSCERPLNKAEIEDLFQVDGISSRLSNYWNKQLPSGKYAISAFIKCLVQDFYTKDELADKLKDLFPNVKPYSIPVVKPTTDRALFIYIGDDHCGLVLKNSLYKKEYSGKTYLERLLKIAEEVKLLDQVFEDVYIINMGDELDGYNQKTTRYDHTLDSLGNKEQFDIYVTARRVFYDDIFSSKIGKTYSVINLNNSNHTGLGFSYMATKAVHMYLELRFPDVVVTHIPKFIDSLTYGKHIINLCHGKDEKYMKTGWPLNLDIKTDLWITDYTTSYMRDEELDINEEWYVSTMKADLHNYNANNGKSGRYVNVPSISSGSNWIEHNYGKSRPGALIEIVNSQSPNITSTPIWF